VIFIPQPTGYGRLKRVDDNANNVQNCPDNQYYQWLALGASNGEASWQIDKIDLVSKFTAFDLGKRYQIASLSLTDSADLLYRIHYSMTDVADYLSVTAWTDLGDKTAANTLSHDFGTGGQALRWVRFNHTLDSPNPSNPQALAYLAAQETGSEVYKLWYDNSFLSRSGSGTSSYYLITLPDAAIGQTSSPQEYRIYAGNVGDLQNITIKLLATSDDGYKCGELSWDGNTWYSWDGSSTTTGAIIDPNTNNTGYNSINPDPITKGSFLNYKTFYVRTKVPSSGVAEGAKTVRFYLEAEVL
jgi:hypothetical protein